MKGHQSIDKLSDQLIRSLQHNLSGVGRQSIERGSIKAGEAFEMFEAPFLLKHKGITFKGMRGVEDSRAATGTFLAGTGMGSGIRAQKKAGITAGCGLTQDKSMTFPFRHRQAVEIAAQATTEDRIAIDVEMVGRDCCREIAIH